ncbi:MAG: LysM peptidoglycan-binding domain-containing protein, partial [Sulfurovum sp.]|nr:LysM peptidoglycan-binding domain-containing protein [Sulfurovum sp.]
MKKICLLLLTVSFAAVTVEAATKTFKYKIKSGDTLSSIANKNHTTITKVRKANAMKKGQVLKVGKVISVPGKATKTYTSTTKYKVKKGDTLSSIARKHHTSVSKLSKLNGLNKNKTLKLGKVLRVKGSTRSTRSGSTLASSLSNLESTKLSKNKVVKAKKSSNSFRLTDMFTGKSSKKCKKLTKDAKRKLGKRYVWGASGRGNTYDCSSFVKYVYRKNGIEIPRTSIRQSKYGKHIARKDLQKGDLIFFDTSKRRKGYVNHVGMYIGNNQFIHASSAKHKVVITSLNKRFYS